MIFYFSGTTSGADPVRMLGSEANVMVSFAVVYGDYDKGTKRSEPPKPDKWLAEILLARTQPELCQPVTLEVNDGDYGYIRRKEATGLKALK